MVRGWWSASNIIFSSSSQQLFSAALLSYHLAVVRGWWSSMLPFFRRTLSQRFREKRGTATKCSGRPSLSKGGTHRATGPVIIIVVQKVGSTAFSVTSRGRRSTNACGVEMTLTSRWLTSPLVPNCLITVEKVFFFLPCRARHDSSDGRSSSHTIRIPLKRSQS